ncbi:heterokaryon incompatibility protein-domain-containing protein [Mariannaea sp. PMI_226]|nr:heterokaryon incompatibility protein-domain-containing protein [Mariannaea sp. PMI_226]
MSTFQYRELDLAKDSIRILRIAKGSFLDDISCELIETLPNTEEWPTYYALSYTWRGLEQTPGGPNHLPHVFVNGHRFNTTESLCLALYHIRSLDEDVYLWADAICINQEDNKEKGHQVRQMRDVYKTAEEVFIWLGLSNEDIKDLMESISWIDRRVAMSKARGNSGSWIDLCRNFLIERLGSLGSLPHSRQGQALAELLTRPWFKRIWILQEVAMARKARILCGPHSCPARTFALMPFLMGLEVDEHAQSVLDIMPRFRDNTWWSSSRCLHDLLVKFSRSEATEKRDKIYALLGMSEDAHDSARFYPSYQKTEKEVYRDTASFLIFGEVLGHNHFNFPDFTLQELCLPIIQLAEKTLSSILGQEDMGGPPALRTVRRLMLPLNEGKLKMSDILLSLAKKQEEMIKAGLSNEELLRAYAWASDRNGVERMIAAGVDTNAIDDYGKTAFEYAVAMRDSGRERPYRYSQRGTIRLEEYQECAQRLSQTTHL